MAIISIEAGPISPADTNTRGTYYYNSHTPAAQDFSIVAPEAAAAASTSAIYRGRLGANYVYSTGTPPGGGATDIVIIGYI